MNLSSQPVFTPGRSFRIALAVAVFWLIPRLAILWFTGAPDPFIHDEMSYLLGADTFAHGRLTNPSPPITRFFESPHILVRPTYASKYPPGQALWLALGQKVFGAPFAGIILEGFAMIFCFGLMFCAWVSPGWAIVFSFVTALCFQWPMPWTNSFMGGCVAATGAALLLFATGFFRNSSGARAAGIAGGVFAIALLFLFMSRPYEGGVLVLGVAGSMLLRFRPWKRFLPFALSALPLLLGGLWWTMDYNRAVTGSAFELPYMLHERMYATVPVFWFLPLRPEPVYANPRLAAQHGLHGTEAEDYYRVRTAMSHLGPFFGLARILITVLGPLFAFLLLSPIGWRDSRCRFLLPLLCLSFLASFIVTFKSPHYLAPLITASLLFAACLADSHGMAVGPHGRRRWASALVMLSVAYSLGVLAVGLYRHDRLVFVQPRSDAIAECLRVPGKHLVFVRYASGFAVGAEWVYNGADLNSERVIFAHDFGPAENRLLERYYPDRTVWTAAVEHHENVSGIAYKLWRGDQ